MRLFYGGHSADDLQEMAMIMLMMMTMRKAMMMKMLNPT